MSHLMSVSVSLVRFLRLSISLFKISITIGIALSIGMEGYNAVTSNET